MGDAVADRPWRCFVAVPISEQLRSELSATVAALRADQALGADWRWTDPAGWHLTLAFLGATDPALVPDLERKLAAAVGGLEPFTLPTGGLGAFPSRRAGRVLWYGVDDRDGRLRTVAGAVRQALGLDEGRFRPHLTLARARDPRGTEATFTQDVETPAGEVVVDRAVLYRSHLGRRPARYEALSVAPFHASVEAQLPVGAAR